MVVVEVVVDRVEVVVDERMGVDRFELKVGQRSVGKGVVGSGEIGVVAVGVVPVVHSVKELVDENFLVQWD